MTDKNRSTGGKSIEQLCSCLGRIASQYEAGTSEYRSLEAGAVALTFLQMKGLMSDFWDFFSHLDDELSAEQQAHLKKLGLE